VVLEQVHLVDVEETAMRPGQEELLKTVNGLIAKNIANGELNKLYHKWLKTDLPAMPAQ